LFGRLGRPPPEIIFVPLCLPLIHDTVPSARVGAFKTPLLEIQRPAVAAQGSLWSGARK
jgi:hypothetical protein